MTWHNDIFYLSPAPPLPSAGPCPGRLLNPGPLPPLLAPTPKASPSSLTPGKPPRLESASQSQTHLQKESLCKDYKLRSSSFASTKTFTALTPKGSDRVRVGSRPGQLYGVTRPWIRRQAGGLQRGAETPLLRLHSLTFDPSQPFS